MLNMLNKVNITVYKKTSFLSLHYLRYICTTTWVIVKVLLYPLYNKFIVTLLSKIILVLCMNRQAQIQLVKWQKFCGNNFKDQMNLNHNKNLQYQQNTEFFLQRKVWKKHTNNKCTENCTILPVQTKHGIIFTIYT